MCILFASSNEQISKYFTINKPCTEDSASSNSDQFDSPYKKSLSEIKYVFGTDDLDKDFRTPKPVKVQKKIQHKRSAPLRQTKLKSKLGSSKCKPTVNKNTIFRATQDNFGLADVDPDHLQMALALSKSTYAVEYSKLSQDPSDIIPNFLSPEKIPKGKTTLERYGFKSNKPKLPPEMKREFSEIPKKNKNSKFRFITPTLVTRTAEERETIITTKISLVLCNTKSSNEELQELEYENELCSDVLKKFKGNGSIFAANSFSFENNNKYYKKNLNISPTGSKCGCLLKKWENIPGREKSPIRGEFKSKQTDKSLSNCVATISFDSCLIMKRTGFEINNPQENNNVLSNIKSNSNLFSPLSKERSPSRDCTSPDLFDSDSETEYTPPKTPDAIDDFSQSLLSPSKKQQKSNSSQPDNTKNIPKFMSFKTGSLEDDNTEEIIMSLSQKSLPLTKQESSISTDIREYSEDEDTEELYVNSLKGKEDFVVNLIQNSPSDDKQLYLKLQLHLKSQKADESIVDLTQSSDDDSSSHYSTDIIENKSNIIGKIDTKQAEKGFPKNVNTQDSDFDMSPLYLKDSDNVFENEIEKDPVTACKEKQTVHNDVGRRSKTSFGISFALDGLDDSKTVLNVTDYITQVLNQNETETSEEGNAASPVNSGECSNTKIVDNLKDNLEDVRKDTGQDDDIEIISSQESYSNESLVISDEELNYSSIHSKDPIARGNKQFYNLSDAEETFENNEYKTDLMDIDEVYSAHSALKKKYRNPDISTPVHNRISELRGNSPYRKTSLAEALLEDSFNALLENSKVLKELEGETSEKVVGSPPPENTENKCTPEKLPAESATSTTTPDNNLIIKTTNVTPLANYDAMDTPGITKELQKFGLKPLKRQRGVKLLQYLYECTHPLVEPDEIEESPDEDEERVVKRRRKTGKTNGSTISSITAGENILRHDQSDIEIVGDTLLKNENFDDLIFERKYSVRILSCRVPLQIVWHNFLSQNAHIKENILLYEPLQLEVLYAMMKEQTGCKFHIQDLLTFFDRKCITIRTAQGSQGKRKA